MGKKLDELIEHMEGSIRAQPPPSSLFDRGVVEGWRSALNAAREIRDGEHHTVSSPPDEPPIDHLARAEAEIGFPDPSARSLVAAITHLIAYLKEQQ